MSDKVKPRQQRKPRNVGGNDSFFYTRENGRDRKEKRQSNPRNNWEQDVPESERWNDVSSL